MAQQPLSPPQHQYLVRVSAPLEGIKPLLCLSLGMLQRAARLSLGNQWTQNHKGTDDQHPLATLAQ